MTGPGAGRILLVTNDFPPRPGGIQSYLHELAVRLRPGALTVLASTWPDAADTDGRCAAFDAAQPFAVHRMPTTMMLPTPDAVRRAVELVPGHETVWFGAAAPLGLMAPALRRAGVRRVLASTHGHEVGWSMLPASRQLLHRIGREADVVTTVSRYTRARIASALGPDAALEPLPSGIDTTRFRPDTGARAEIRRRYGLGERPVVGIVSRLVRRKGQDVLIRALPAIRRRVPGAALLIAGDGPDRDRLRRLAHRSGVEDDVVFTGPLAHDEIPAHHAALDVFALPCRTLGRGLDVEGLGIVLLEASASGVPVVAGRSGGAPETVRGGPPGTRTGRLTDGRDPGDVAEVVADLLADPDAAASAGAAGRRWMQAEWTWSSRARRLEALARPE
ncbi:glycosyltransferase family 4 protein [Actinomycetospora sp. NBRC 106378]|uniref:glycosyltransferase family 4 protein n=1 Tax=Actinomycetospora sp. NBRC 106378 TaxID=3032208 RepID=UPI0024A34FDC|nr:glycosyltransferase family 4 protein [Actinomycetospora sp. NBRC 106378]GLZ53325.1 GDP-mannose-dependent alpha-(1-6)-phosphatidylinositol monomannoside mannosyltransferase [Actinomycetospora sp. NBRC 106378]